MSQIVRVRTCKECKQTFADPESFRRHKIRGIGCRSVEAMLAAGFVKWAKGWKSPKLEEGKNAL